MESLKLTNATYATLTLEPIQRYLGGLGVVLAEITIVCRTCDVSQGGKDPYLVNIGPERKAYPMYYFCSVVPNSIVRIVCRDLVDKSPSKFCRRFPHPDKCYEYHVNRHR